MTFGASVIDQPVVIQVDQVDTSHAIVAWHFLSYGSASSTLPSTLSQTLTSGSGRAAVLTPAWTGSTYVGTIATVSSDGTTITVNAPGPAIPASRTVNKGWYFGDDDGVNINNAIASLAASGATQINLSGNCGTTVQINGAAAFINNPSLVGLGLSSTGLYALGPINPTVGNGSNVFNDPSTNTGTGGGLANMTIEAGGLTAGPAVEIDGGKTQTFANLEVRDAIGSGNGVFRCGSAIVNGAQTGGNWSENIRAETDNALFSGAQFPDGDVDLGYGCHDSFFAKLIAVNATIANIRHYGDAGLHIENPHTFNTLYPDVPGAADYGIATAQHDYILGSQVDDANFASVLLAPGTQSVGTSQRVIETWVDCAALKGTGVPPAFALNTTGHLNNNQNYIDSVANLTGAVPGMIVVGVGIPFGDKITSIAGTTVYLAQNLGNSGTESITITGGFRGIEISGGNIGATVTATSASSACNIDPTALVVQDGVADPSTAVFANGTASYSTLHSNYGQLAYKTYFSNVSLNLGAPNINTYHVCMTTTIGPTTVTLPAVAQTGLQYTVDDCSGSAASHHITINGGSIDGSSSYVISTAYGSWTGYYTGTIWKTVGSR